MPLHEILRRQAARIEGPVPLGWLLGQAGSTVKGLLLVVAALPSVLPIPGVGNVTGAVLMGMAVLMAAGRVPAALPPALAGLRLSPRHAARLLGWLADLHEWAALRLRHRLPWLVSPAAWVCSAAPVALMGLVIFLPIPLGNLLGACSLVALGLGHGFRDGWVVVAGWLMALATLAYSALLFWGAAALWAPMACLLTACTP